MHRMHQELGLQRHQWNRTAWACDTVAAAFSNISKLVKYMPSYVVRAVTSSSWRLHRRGKGGKALPGPRYVVPLVGCIVEMVLDPFGFWERQRECVPAPRPCCDFFFS